MAAPLLTTKLFTPPIRRELVSRPRLIERLNEGMERKLTLVSAPAGYGKTTLLSEWIHQGRGGATSPLPVAWLSLDAADNDPIRFLSYLFGAAQTIVPHLGEGLLSALQSPQPPPAESVLTSLINELTAIPQDCSQCCILGLVLDDYHLVDNQEIHDAVAFLLDHLPPPPEGMHLIIATRRDPLLPLPRWRAGAQMTEIREADLRFTLEEATEFLNRVMGPVLSSDDIGTLAARTEGWITGLQLAALSMRGLDAAGSARFVAAFAGDDRYIVDYLVDEVLLQRPAGTKTFLLKTSILERMTGPLCDAVTGGEGGQNTLEMLEQANMFVVPLNSRRRWYRYHHLFADLLRHRLRATAGAAGLTSLHLRASEWYEENGFVAEAVSHAFAARDYERATSLVEQHAQAMFARSELSTIMNWVDVLPADLVQARPWLCVFHAWALRLTGARAEAVESRLRDAELALERPQAPQSEDDARTIRGHIAAIRAYQALYREEILRAIDLARQTLESLPEGSFARGLAALALGWASRFNGDLVGASRAFTEARTASLAAGNIYTAVAATCRLAYTQVLGGQLHQGVESCREALRMAVRKDGQRLPVAGYAYVYMGGVYREWNDLEAAARCLVEGIDLCRQVGYIMDQVVGYTTLARVRQSQRDRDGARDALQNARRLSQRMKGYVFARRWVEDCQVRLWVTQKDPSADPRQGVAKAARWAQASGLRVDDELDFKRELEHIILARVLVAQGVEQPEGPYLAHGLDLLARLLRAAETAGWMGKTIEILSLQAMALQAHDNTDQALIALERALTLAEPEGYVRLFVDEGPPMANLLLRLCSRQIPEAAAQDIPPGYAHRLLAVFETETKDRQPAPRRPPSESRGEIEGLVEPLSSRELEVLQLIAEGLTNQEIASRLFLAPGTVKVHTRNIYGKLDVHSRIQAVARARHLGLL